MARPVPVAQQTARPPLATAYFMSKVNTSVASAMMAKIQNASR
jgi:hypothetical protein